MSKSDPSSDIASGELSKTAGSDDVVLPDGSPQKSPEDPGATIQQIGSRPKSNVQTQNNETLKIG